MIKELSSELFGDFSDHKKITPVFINILTLAIPSLFGGGSLVSKIFIFAAKKAIQVGVKRWKCKDV